MDRRDIVWENRSIVVHGKGAREREVYFTPRASILLKRYLKTRDDTEPALFVTERRSYRRMSISRIREVVKQIASASGVEVNVYPHRMRHTYATHLLDRGASLDFVQSMLGHTKIETTKIYCQLSGQRRREMYQRYGGSF